MAEPENGEISGQFTPAQQDSVLECPQCRAVLNQVNHGHLVFDGHIWCDRCHSYDRELIRPREFPEIESWSRVICAAFGFPPILLEIDDNPALFRRETSVLMAETDHGEGSIRFYPPGCRLATLCHELAHLFTGQDHTGEWAGMCAALAAWVKSRVDAGQGVEGYKARQSIYECLQKRVY